MYDVWCMKNNNKNNDSTSSSASYSPDELIQQLEFQIINQDVIQT